VTDDDPIPSDQRAGFAALPREVEPASDLEQRVVDRLHRDGVLPARRRGRPWVAVAAAVLMFASGVVADRFWSMLPTRSEGARYVLLLYGAPTSSADIEAARVAEYGAWAREEAARGRLENGEKLDNRALVLGGTAYGVEQPSGFFIIRASSDLEAQAVASRCPHLRHGGTVIVRRIES
jgi:hypothetical protein